MIVGLILDPGIFFTGFSNIVRWQSTIFMVYETNDFNKHIVFSYFNAIDYTAEH